MYGSAQPDAPISPEKAGGGVPSTDPAAAPGNTNGEKSLGEPELQAALQLLVERAQYITGATGAALALLSGEEMVCRASAGASAPPVGVRLQVRSGLTGESISRRQLLRCDNAEKDPRVNLETCREMGIASIVVLPLLQRSGEIRGLFELFSDHAYAFEERDLKALERMADLTMTALDLSESRPGAVAGFVRAGIAPRGAAPVGSPAEPANAAAVKAVAEAAAVEHEQEIHWKHDQKVDQGRDQGPAEKETQVAMLKPEEQGCSELVVSAPPEELSAALQGVPVPEAMRRVQKCAGCGFPVSEGRTYCLDCEKKEGQPPASSEPVPVEFVPSFLDAPAPPASWLGDHVNLLAIVVLILGILVAVVVFR